eukprot:RCo037851
MGNQLPAPVTSKVVQRAGNVHFRAAAVGVNGRREAMEDDHMMNLTDKFGIFGVFDGHAGSQCSSFCAKAFAEEIAKLGPPVPDHRLEVLCSEVDEKFGASCTSSGSTAAIAIITPLEGAQKQYDVQISHVGDSRVLVGKNMGAALLHATTDHKPSLKAERERIESCGGMVAMDRVDGALAMSRAMGDFEYKKGPGGPNKQKVICKPDVAHVTVGVDDLVLVCCDGVFEAGFTNNQVMEYVKEQLQEDPDDVAAAACALAEEAIRRGSGDNVTCIIIRLSSGKGYSHKGFIPGPLSSQNPGFCRQYRVMAERAGLTFARALEMRYDMVRKLMEERVHALRSQSSTEGQDEELGKLRTELLQFKPAPAKDLTGAARTKVFEHLAEKLCSSSDGNRQKLTPEFFNRLAAAEDGDEALANL